MRKSALLCPPEIPVYLLMTQILIVLSDIRQRGRCGEGNSEQARTSSIAGGGPKSVVGATGGKLRAQWGPGKDFNPAGAWGRWPLAWP